MADSHCVLTASEYGGSANMERIDDDEGLGEDDCLPPLQEVLGDSLEKVIVISLPHGRLALRARGLRVRLVCGQVR